MAGWSQMAHLSDVIEPLAREDSHGKNRLKGRVQRSFEEKCI